MTPERACVSVTGSDAETLLQNLVTCEVMGLEDDELRFGALLTPQGKVLFDFFLSKIENGFRLETRASSRDALVMRLNLYKLRADAAVSASADLVSIADDGMIDPRCKALPGRRYGPDTAEMPDAYHAARVANGVPEAGWDFEYGEAFPHDVLMDRFEGIGSGIAFDKGCFVGQEVVSRMKHRGTARRRPIVIALAGSAERGNPVHADGREIGHVGTVAGLSALAIVRLDRAEAAEVLTINAETVSYALPGFANLSGA